MENGKNTNLNYKESWLRIRTILLYVLVVLLICSMVVLVVAETTNMLRNTERTETREQIKSRLMRQARDGWDPYSADMTLDEFYALMELFDEGKLPLGKKASDFTANDGTVNEPSVIPRTKFLFAGLPDSYAEEDGGIDEEFRPLEYKDTKNYEPINEDVPDDVKEYYYPKGLDPYNRGYDRPPFAWDGVQVDSTTLRALLVLEEENENLAIASKVDQSLFVEYKDYYVKQITVDGADINVLGMIKIPGTEQYVCYFLSAAQQSTQVSTTTMPDPQKFIVQYVPVEHMVNYEVRSEDGTLNPYGFTEEDIFGAYHPSRTTDGAYSFDVTAPYGYTTKILICINMDKKLWFSTTPKGDGTDDNENDIRALTDNDFPVSINHTGKYEDMKKSWLESYYTYLCENGFIDESGRVFYSRVGRENQYQSGLTVNSYQDFLRYCINQENIDNDGHIQLTWAFDDPNKEAHDSMLMRMTERINDFILHNNGYDLGTYPVWKLQDHTKLVPNMEQGPGAFNWNETFYNHLVKADRTIVAVLTPLEEPMFSNEGVSETNNMDGRGANASDQWAYATDDRFENYYLNHNDSYDNGGLDSYQANGWPNIQTDEYNWTWPKNGIKKAMKPDAQTGTYSYNWMFQTNSGSSGFTLDVLEINGVAMTIPYRPKYQVMNYDDGKTPQPDENFSWQTVNYLPDGAKVTVQFWFGWNSGQNQRHYRIMIEGAHTNVNITSLNLMMGDGANEFSVYSLTGVHSDAAGDSQTTEAIEFYNDKNGWVRTEKSQVVVDSYNNYISYRTGDNGKHGANIRFKVADGFGNPYYMWESPRYGITMDESGRYQASAGVTMANKFAKPNIDELHPIIYFSKMNGLDEEEGGLVDGKLNCQYIYYDDEIDDGYYYIRVTGQKNPINPSEDLKIALLTIVARTVRYVVRYIPNPAEYVQGWEDEVPVPNPKNMPQFVHEGNCVFAGEDHKELGKQYDDNGGVYYDLLVNTMISIPSNDHGIIRPTDPYNDYRFVDWVLVDEDYKPVLDKHNEEIHFLSGAINLTEISQYAVHRVQFSTTDMDIYVIRFVPYWEMIDEPFVYNIVISWVDALGDVHDEEYSDWDEIITEKPKTDDVFVYINKMAGPFLDWFATHPTYTFWDDVNNSSDDTEIARVLKSYLDSVKHSEHYESILPLLKSNYNDEDKTGFKRLGGDIFAVHEDQSTIRIWMYEGLGGVVFNTVVNEEGFVHDEEFYFTVADSTNSLNGQYRAFAQYVFNTDGTRKKLVDDDAWIVTFTNGAITSIVKDGVEYGTYFTLHGGEEVALYVPSGSYNVYELGSKSGGSYKVNVGHHDTLGNEPTQSTWTLPEGELWLKGSNKTVSDATGVSQILVKVDLKVGESEIVEALTFYNKTTTLSVENRLGEMDSQKQAEYKSKIFTFKVTLSLPDGENPLNYDGKYYFNMNSYSKVEGKTVAKSSKFEVKRSSDSDKGTNVWIGELALKPEESATIVMTGTVKFWVEEITTHNLIPKWISQNGQVQIGNIVYAICTNYLEGTVPTVTQGYLVITETGGKSNESFLFKITNEQGVSMIVSVKGGGTTYVYAPLGKYTIEEMSDWSWRYENGKSGTEAKVTVFITVENATKDTPVKVTYSHNSNNRGWLGGENSNSSFFTAA